MGASIKEIYLDNASTTKPWPKVRDAVCSCLEGNFGNPSSQHSLGARAARIVADAADCVKELVGSGQWKVIFTSGGSEADTTAVLGSVPRGKRKRVVTSTVEHAAVTDACHLVASKGGEVVEIGAGESGVVDPEEFSRNVDDATALVTLTHLANEMGTIQPVAEVARAAKRASGNCLVHIDAVQAVAQLEILDYPAEVDMISLSAHKIHGPKGVGALLIRPGISIRPLVCGGDQQDGIRPGTLNVPGIAGFGEAAKLMLRKRADSISGMSSISAFLLNGIVSKCSGVRALGEETKRATGMIILAVERARSQTLLHTLEAYGVIASAGSACHSRRTKPPKCLTDAGLRGDEAAIRLSLSVDTTMEEADLAVQAFIRAVEAVRSGKASLASQSEVS